MLPTQHQCRRTEPSRTLRRAGLSRAGKRGACSPLHTPKPHSGGCPHGRRASPGCSGEKLLHSHLPTPPSGSQTRRGHEIRLGSVSFMMIPQHAHTVSHTSTHTHLCAHTPASHTSMYTPPCHTHTCVQMCLSHQYHIHVLHTYPTPLYIHTCVTAHTCHTHTRVTHTHVTQTYPTPVYTHTCHIHTTPVLHTHTCVTHTPHPCHTLIPHTCVHTHPCHTHRGSPVGMPVGSVWQHRSWGAAGGSREEPGSTGHPLPVLRPGSDEEPAEGVRGAG